MSGRPPAGPKIDDVVKCNNKINKNKAIKIADMEKLQAEKRSAELSVQKFANDRDRVDEQIEVRFGELWKMLGNEKNL